MNFVKYEKQLKELLTTSGGKFYSGNYIYSRDEDDKTFKIGMSQAGLWKRLKQAKSCYPFKSEYFLKYVIISLDGHYTKGQQSTTINIEKALHNESKHLNTVKMEVDEIEEGKRPREYRLFANNTQLYNLLKTTLNKNRKMWDYIVVFNPNGWHLIPNNRRIDKPIKTITNLKPKSSYAKPKIDSMALNKTKIILPKDIKVGDVIPKSQNWESFKIVQIINKKHVVAKFKGSNNHYDIKF